MNNFKILSLKVTQHPFLGDIISPGLQFVTEHEEKNGAYTTVMIGPNGTGKSQILRLISDILEEIKAHSLDKSYKFRLNYQYELKVIKGSITYQIEFRRQVYSALQKAQEQAKSMCVYVLQRGSNSKRKEIENDGRMLPYNIVANSFLVNDKFRFSKTGNESAFYNYLGVRDSASTARTRTYVRTVVSALFRALNQAKEVKSIKKVISYIGYDQTFLGVSYNARYKATFFTGKLTQKEFQSYLSTPSSFSKRKTESFAISFYKSIENDNVRIRRIVLLINILAIELNLQSQSRNRISLNLLEGQMGSRDLMTLDDLLKLDLIESPSISFKKFTHSATGAEINVDNFSSGEFNLFSAFIGLRSIVKQNSLILIDEPEISLHPNWQMKYVHFLKEIFDDLPSIHFIIATHSHFVISDLKNSTSEIIKLARGGDKMQYYSIKGNTYGHSAESILFNIFGLRSSRNYYFEVEIRELLTLLSGSKKLTDESERKKFINSHIANLYQYILDKNDPLNLILEQARESIRSR